MTEKHQNKQETKIVPQENFAPDKNPPRLAGLSSFKDKALEKINEAPTTQNWPAKTVL